MNKSIRIIIALAVVIFVTSACKTTQKVATIPSGAKIAAKAPATVAPVASPVTPVVSEPEVVKNETFSLVDGEKDALKSKYHVVVGSFGKQTNAQGLQKNLITEGYKALVVLNEKGMYRVLISSFNDYAKSHLFIKEISTRFPDAWVLVQK